MLAARLAAAVAAWSSACVLIDQRLRLNYANAAAYDLAGLRARRRTLPGLLAAGQRLFSEVDQERLIDAIAVKPNSSRVGSAEAAREIEVTTVADGRVFRLTIQPIVSAGGRYLGSLVVGRDGTNERDLDRLKDELVANISHELQTPLASVRACAEMLIDRLDEGDPAVRDRLLGIILAEAKGLSGLVENILDLSRLEGGQLRPRLQPVDLRWAVDDVVAGLEPQARTRGQTISRCYPGIPCVALADEQMVRVIVTNLVGNAMKYGRQGGHIRITVSERGELACIRVADDGPGIPAEALPRIFERFYRVRSTTESSVKGAGLGLALVKGLTEAHGGRVEVESAPGSDTVFTVSLPGYDLAVRPS